MIPLAVVQQPGPVGFMAQDADTGGGILGEKGNEHPRAQDGDNLWDRCRMGDGWGRALGVLMGSYILRLNLDGAPIAFV